MGPTASGKTELAAALAEAFDGEVVGADSRQVYRYMEAGTAKPALDLRRRIRHHMIDVADPDDYYDVARWRAAALDCLADAAARSKTVIVCGGTGLYVRSLTRGLFRGPAADERLRAGLLQRENAEPGCLHRRLREADAESAARIHPNDLIRTVRALEVLELSGRPLSEWHREHGLREAPFEVLNLHLELPLTDLERRIGVRSRGIVEAGIVEELQGLFERGYARDCRAFAAIGYREAALCLDGSLPAGDLSAAIALATRRYAKRQRTWLRGQSDGHVIEGAGDRRAFELVEAFLS